MGLLDGIASPEDLRRLPDEDLPALAEEVREFLVRQVSATGGHLGPNLGVVEVTLALHRVFESPRDVILWDTGHQAYVHKMITGRWQGFGTLRKEGGLSGYPSRAESEHDVIENSHASTALSYADGISKAFELHGEIEGPHARHVVAVVGDGSLTGGMAWEALNNIAASDRPLVILVNDNERSYSPTIGGMAHHLATLRTTQGYERFLGWGRRTLQRTPVVGAPVYEALHGMKKGLKDIVAPQGMFEDLGLKYVGPIDGHDTVDATHGGDVLSNRPLGEAHHRRTVGDPHRLPKLLPQAVSITRGGQAKTRHDAEERHVPDAVVTGAIVTGHASSI